VNQQEEGCRVEQKEHLLSARTKHNLKRCIETFLQIRLDKFPQIASASHATTLRPPVYIRRLNDCGMEKETVACGLREPDSVALSIIFKKWRS
jgi:hypothetical protein